MTAPEQSAWLSKSTAPAFCHLDVTDSSEPVQLLPDGPLVCNLKNLSDSNDLVLEAIRSSESLSCHMDEIISLPVTTVVHIPRSVRPELGKILAKELKHASKDGLWGFARLFLFPKAVLRCPPRGGRKKRVVVKAVLLSRIRRWLEGDFVSLWEEARLDASHGDKSANRSHVSLDSANAKRSLSLAREGRYSDAMRSLGSSGCAPHDDPSAVSELRSRHLDHCLPSWNTDIPSPLVVTSSSVLAALHGFPKASSPGGSKL